MRISSHPLVEQVMGIEPTSQPWEGRVLPMNYTCERRYFNSFPIIRQAYSLRSLMCFSQLLILLFSLHFRCFPVSTSLSRNFFIFNSSPKKPPFGTEA